MLGAVGRNVLVRLVPFVECPGIPEADFMQKISAPTDRAFNERKWVEYATTHDAIKAMYERRGLPASA